jgi:hypothetical protein
LRDIAIASLALTALGTSAAPPSPGLHAAELCVSAVGAVPSCGAVQLDWRRDGRARLRVSDIVYTLQLKTSQVDVVLQHGTMQIDEFTAAYEWQGDILSFVDAAKNVRYEVRPASAR